MSNTYDPNNSVQPTLTFDPFPEAPAPELVQAQQTQAPVKEEPKIALEDVRARLAQLSRDGKTAQVKALIQKYGANKLSEVNPDDYEALLLDAEVI